MSWLAGRGRLAGPLALAGLAVVVVGSAVWVSASSPAARSPLPAHASSAAGHGAAAPGTISTVAGGIGGPAPANSVPLDTCPVSYARGALYAGDDLGPAVRRIGMRSGRLTTVAGDGTTSGPGNGVPAAQTGLNDTSASDGGPCTIAAAADPAGNLLIAVNGSVHVVAARTGTFYRLPMLAGHIYTIAHAGPDPVDVRADRWGNLVTVSGQGACQGDACPADNPGLVQVLAERPGTFYGQRMLAGRLYTLAGSQNLARRPVNEGNGGPGPRALIGYPSQLALDAAGNVLIADTGGALSNFPSEIRVVAARDGIFYGQRMRTGDIYTIAGGGHLATANGVPASEASVTASGVATDAAGNVVFGDGDRLRVVAARDGIFYGQRMRTGDIYTVANIGVFPPHSRNPLLDRISYVAVDGAGNLVFADAGPRTYRALAVRTGTFYGIHMTAGHIYTIAGAHKSYPLGMPAASAPLPGDPVGVAEDRSGDLIIGLANGSPAYVPARTGTYFGVPMVAGHLYRIPTAGCGHGGCAGAVAADASGNVLIAQQARNQVLVVPPHPGRFYGQRMRAGRVYPVAGDGKAKRSGDGGPARRAGLSPIRVTADGHGDLFIADNPSVAHPDSAGGWIRMVPARSGTYFGHRMRAGDIYTVAGNGRGTGVQASKVASGVPATATAMNPWSVAVDRAGNLVLASDHRVRVVAAHTRRFYGTAMKTGYIYTIAGPFPGSHDVAIDSHGNVLALDPVSAVVRLVATHPGTFYGQRVTAGQVVIIAGRRHTHSGPGDGGPATQAWLKGPEAITVGSRGRLLIAEQAGRRIRAVSP